MASFRPSQESLTECTPMNGAKRHHFQTDGTGNFQRSHAAFHEVAKVVGIWVVAFCVGVHTLAALRTILVPLFWAFFLMMGLVPATHWVEALLWRFCCCGKRNKVQPEQPDPEKPGEYLGMPVGRSASSSSLVEDETDCVHSSARIVSVVIVAGSFVGFVTLFFMMIYVSAMHMQEGWSHYQDGLKRMSGICKHIIQKYSKGMPPSVVDDISKKALVGLEDVLSHGLGTILEGVTHSMVGIMMMLLYMVFWLCQPMYIGKGTTSVFRQYIILKSLASAGYASCVWLLLHFCNIDLAIVFALITFLFNFVPEVGPFLAMVVPLPIVLFDGRLEHPMITLAVVFGGNMCLKCLWGNIIEVKLVEAQREMKMHPVVILFFVAFFGWIWGATGMLLSVPFVAVLKSSIHLIPTVYRDPILVILEGDERAPENYERYHERDQSYTEIQPEESTLSGILKNFGLGGDRAST